MRDYILLLEEKRDVDFKIVDQLNKRLRMLMDADSNGQFEPLEYLDEIIKEVEYVKSIIKL